MTAGTWQPEQYGLYADERGRPFHDLLARVRPDDEPRLVVDLGCGPATLTATLAQRWPGARVIGVDSSAEMVAAARGVRSGVEVVEADLTTWTPPGPVDVIVANAVLHWLPGHLALLGRLVGWLAPGGWIAVQVPANFGEPTHTLLRELRADPRWSAHLAAARSPSEAGVASPEEYLAALMDAGCDADVWATQYVHLLPGDDPVLEWMRGAGARPTLAALPDDARPAFEAEYAARLRRAYPRRRYGETEATALPYRRIFLVGRTRVGARGPAA